MNLDISAATARRVLLQLRHDPRTVGLLVAVPALLLVLVRYVFDSAGAFNIVAPALLGVFPFTLMFLVTSITTLRERNSGTLERLMTTPIAKLDLLAGYAGAFGIVAVVQVVVAVLASHALGLVLGNSFWWLLLITAVEALLGVALGLFASAFARTEFQALQFMPLIVLPQLLLCGLFYPRNQMATVLRWVSNALPMSYAVDALNRVSTGATLHGPYTRDLIVVAGCGVVALVLAAATLPRQTR